MLLVRFRTNNPSIYLFLILILRKIFQMTAILWWCHFLLIYPWNCGLYPEEKTKDSILMQNGFLMGTPEWFFLRSGQQFGQPLANILPFAIDSFIFGSLIRPFSPSLNLYVCNLRQQKVWAIPPLTTSLMCMIRKPAGEINNWLGQWPTDKKFMLWSGILRNVAFKAVFFNNPDYSFPFWFNFY